MSGRKPRESIMTEAQKKEATAPSLPDSPEIRELIAKAVAEEMAKLTLNAAQAPAAQGLGGDDAMKLFNQMALAIAQMSNQTNDRKAIDPAILQERAAARERMSVLIKGAHAQIKAARSTGDEAIIKKAELDFLPRYRVIAKCCLNERIVVPFRQDPATKAAVPQNISWSGEPNDAMRPVNDVAKRIYAEFRASRGELALGTIPKPLWLSPNGLVIEGDHPKKQIHDEEQRFKENISIDPLPNDPTADFVNILGTVAAPARQNYEGKPV